MRTELNTLFDPIQVQLAQVVGKGVDGCRCQREEKTQAQRVELPLNVLAELIGFPDLPEMVPLCPQKGL